MHELLALFFTFLKVGAFTFGGGYAMLPMVSQEVLAHHWMQQEDIVNFIAVSEATPGPFAVNISTYVGSVVAGLPGAICATFGVVLPSFLIILIVACVFEKFKKSKAIKGMMLGLHPAVVGLIGASVVSVGLQVFFPNGFQMNATALFSVVTFFVALFLAFQKKVHPVKLILLGASLGIVFGYMGIL